jgi:hypothetical protein
MIRCVEGAGTAESGVFDPLLHSNHARRRLHFIGAVQRLRNAWAAAGHVEDEHNSTPALAEPLIKAYVASTLSSDTYRERSF